MHNRLTRKVVSTKFSTLTKWMTTRSQMKVHRYKNKPQLPNVLPSKNSKRSCATLTKLSPPWRMATMRLSTMTVQWTPIRFPLVRSTTTSDA